ncbi:unnamed protein product [Mytilus edulis]|uniref:C2H2-type domain-containing protein n=1 Tax=Mytilus edulis TaxID=6550 RepID=A0A8S3VI23_MYTED|nr:unnamed protein product [Mytilus edulis]
MFPALSHLLERNANRRKRVYCEIPPLASTHPDTTTSDITKFRSKNTRKKERQLTFANVVTIRNKIGIVIPVGTSVCANCRRSICSPVPEEKIDNEEGKEISCTASLNEKDYHRRNVNTYNSKSFYNDDPMQEMFETDSFPSTSEQADLSQSITDRKWTHTSLILFLDFITSSHIIKDLPFGERKMRLSSGKIIETPNVIRCMAPAAIIQQFKQYCAENEEIPLELCRVGALTDQRAKDYAEIVQECKRYLKTDFKVHISELATVPDHCSIFALSDKEEAFSCLCGHNHEMVCCNCEQISELLSSLNSLIANSDLKEKEDCRDDYQYKLSQAQTNIFSWKTHIIRTCHQEKAKTEIMNTMGPNDILIVLDWAMKFLPRRYREDQSNWFAKRGLSWHIGVAFRRRNVIESLAFNHIFNGQIPQDSYATSAVILDIVNDLKEQDNSIDKIHLWSDNAGCYKSSETIYALYCSKFVTSYDFCEAQSGKGACDRTAATLKSSIRRYINQGNDVLTATQMKEAIEKTSKKVRYVVKVVETDTSATHPHQKVQVPSISAMNNFEFVENGVKVWRHYKLGAGKLVPLNLADVIVPKLRIIENPSEIVDFHPLVQSSSSVSSSSTTASSASSSSTQQSEDIFTCTNDGCTASFNSHQDFNNHLILDNCEIHSERVSKADVLKTKYVDKLAESQVNSKEITLTGNCGEMEGEHHLSRGWAIKTDRKNKRFSDNQKNFLIERFNIGLQTGHKEDPENVAVVMRSVKKADGTRRFSIEEFLTPQQITSFFSRHCRKNGALREQAISDIESSLLN